MTILTALVVLVIIDRLALEVMVGGFGKDGGQNRERKSNQQSDGATAKGGIQLTGGEVSLFCVSHPRLGLAKPLRYAQRLMHGR